LKKSPGQVLIAVVVLMAILAVGMAYYLFQTARDQKRQLA